MSGGGAAQMILPEKRQVAVGRIVVDGVPGRREGRRTRPQIGIEILQAQYRGID